MVKVQTNFRLDEDLLTELKTRADAQGISTTELLSQFIKQGLGLVNTDVNTVAIQSNDELYKLIDERIAATLQPYIQRIATLEYEIKKFSSLIESRPANQAYKPTVTTEVKDSPKAKSKRTTGKASATSEATEQKQLTRDELRSIYFKTFTPSERLAFGDKPKSNPPVAVMRDRIAAKNSNTQQS